MIKYIILMSNLVFNGLEDAYYTGLLKEYTFLDAISYRESRNNWCAINHNPNNTYDWGKWQINDVSFKDLEIYKGLKNPNKVKFLEDSTMQKKYVYHFIKRNEDIFKSNGIQPTNTHLFNGWGGIYGYIGNLKQRK